MVRLRALFAAVLLIAACTTDVAPRPAASPSTTFPAGPATFDMTDALAHNVRPPNDPFTLVPRLRGRDGSPGPWEPVRGTTPRRQVGDNDTFTYYDFRSKTNQQVSAVIRRVSDHAYWYVQQDVPVDPARLAQSALEFDGRIYPTDHRIYGSEWSPGIDNDPRITILFARIPDVAGYFSAADEYPRWINPLSAEREMIYISIDAAQPGSPYLLSVLAHEFAHMIQFNTRVRAATWFNEGLAQVAEIANGYPPSFAAAYFRDPDTQLTDWADTPSQAAAHYGHAALFLQYLADRFGGTDLIRALMRRGVDTPLDVDAALRPLGTTFEDAYLDFAATIGLADQTSAPAPYRYASLRIPTVARLATEQTITPGESRHSSVQQDATRYFPLPAGDLSIDLHGATQTRLLPTDPHGGGWLWWSDRGDGIDTSLQRRVDLRGAPSATLTFWTWFDIEKDYDYAYVSVSPDGGRTWRTLAGTTTTQADPNGNNLGNGITGVSGGGTTPIWVRERMDLTPFAGKEILLRFDYVTDPAVNKDGFALDDIAIPELHWQDDAETPSSDWQALGFVRSSNLVSESFGVQVLRLGDDAGVQRVRTARDGTAHLDVRVASAGGALLAVTGFAAETTQAAPFVLTVWKR